MKEEKIALILSSRKGVMRSANDNQNCSRIFADVSVISCNYGRIYGAISLAENGLRSRADIADAIMGQRAECVMLNNGSHILEAIETLSRLLGKEERLRHQIKKLPFRDFTEQYAVYEA